MLEHVIELTEDTIVREMLLSIYTCNLQQYYIRYHYFLHCPYSLLLITSKATKEKGVLAAGASKMRSGAKEMFCILPPCSHDRLPQSS